MDHIESANLLSYYTRKLQMSSNFSPHKKVARLFKRAKGRIRFGLSLERNQPFY